MNAGCMCGFLDLLLDVVGADLGLCRWLLVSNPVHQIGSAVSRNFRAESYQTS